MWKGRNLRVQSRNNRTNLAITVKTPTGSNQQNKNPAIGCPSNLLSERGQMQHDSYPTQIQTKTVHNNMRLSRQIVPQPITPFKAAFHTIHWGGRQRGAQILKDSGQFCGCCCCCRCKQEGVCGLSSSFCGTTRLEGNKCTISAAGCSVCTWFDQSDLRAGTPGRDLSRDLIVSIKEWWCWWSRCSRSDPTTRCREIGRSDNPEGVNREII